MSSTLVYHYLAIKDLHDSMYFYEDRELGLGFEFEKRVREKISAIQKHPERYAIRKSYYRETLVKKFPYLIVYH